MGHDLACLWVKNEELIMSWLNIQWWMEMETQSN